MKQRIVGPLAAVVLAATCGMSTTVAADKATDEAAVREIWSTYSAARVAGDAETWLGLWDEEGIRLFPHASTDVLSLHARLDLALLPAHHLLLFEPDHCTDELLRLTANQKVGLGATPLLWGQSLPQKVDQILH